MRGAVEKLGGFPSTHHTRAGRDLRVLESRLLSFEAQGQTIAKGMPCVIVMHMNLLLWLPFQTLEVTNVLEKEKKGRTIFCLCVSSMAMNGLSAFTSRSFSPEWALMGKDSGIFICQLLFHVTEQERGWRALRWTQPLLEPSDLGSSPASATHMLCHPGKVSPHPITEPMKPEPEQVHWATCTKSNCKPRHAHRGQSNGSCLSRLLFFQAQSRWSIKVCWIN